MSAEENKAFVQRGFEALNSRDLQSGPSYFSADMVDHSAPPGQAPGIEGWIEQTRAFLTAFPDVQLGLEDIVAEGDKVVTRSTVRGTHQGPFLGIPATGKKVEVAQIDIWRLDGGKIVEHWGQDDRLGMLQQLGAVPQPEGVGA